MFHDNNCVDTITSLLEGSVAPGILTAKSLQGVLLSARQRNVNDEANEIVSPYGRMPRQPRRPRNRNLPNNSLFQPILRSKNENIVRRKRCRKLDPMPVMSRFQRPVSNSGNQTSSGDTGLDRPDKQSIENLRLGFQQTSSKLQRDADRLKNEIQWIHGHFPVLQLANAKCSRNLRQQLFRNTVVDVSTNFILRKALLFWYHKSLDAQRKERLQLSASRQLIAMFEKMSFDRVAGKFYSWRKWVLECQTQEKMAAAINLQRFATFLRSRREEREADEKQNTLMKALEKLSRNARTLQRAYRRHHRAVQQRQYEAAARKPQHIEMRRTAYNGFIQRQNAAKLLQRTYRAYSKQQAHRRARAIAEIFDRSREKSAQRIQNAWRGYLMWRNYDLPVDILQSLVGQVEFLDAVLSIQRHLRGFQCRFRIKKKNDSTVRIQNCWRAGKCREGLRNERRMIHLRRDLAASCLQRTFRRMRAKRKVCNFLRQSTRPLYLRACDFGDSFRDYFRVPIAKSASVVIQTTWRRHTAYKKKKEMRLRANIIADLIERQRRNDVENRAARFIQRMFKRMIDRRDGKLLLHRYKILFRQEIKRRQQRVIVHKYLEEKSQQRKRNKSIATRRVSLKSSTGTSRVLSLDSYSTEASAFSLDETPNNTSDSRWPASFTDATSPQTESPIQYWSEEYQRAYLFDSVTGISTWL
ncbi:IQ motif, EF-hand binding site [Phytophthora cactorum]|nr:IQ motif, EF-hand binding site [Phytophthora cactorum]